MEYYDTRSPWEHRHGRNGWQLTVGLEINICISRYEYIQMQTHREQVLVIQIVFLNYDLINNYLHEENQYYINAKKSQYISYVLLNYNVLFKS